MQDYRYFRLVKKITDVDSAVGATSSMLPTIAGSVVSVIGEPYIYDEESGRAYKYNSDQSVTVADAAVGAFRYDFIYVTGNGVLTIRQGTEVSTDDYENSAPVYPDRVVPICIIRVAGVVPMLIDARGMVNKNNSKPMYKFGMLEFDIRT